MDNVRIILLGLPALLYAVATAVYFGVYQTVVGVGAEGALPDWQTILFVQLPELVMHNTYSQISSVVLLLAVLVGLTTEAYKFGLRTVDDPSVVESYRRWADIISICSMVCAVVALVVLLRSLLM
jgi:uncharacterized membrane protein YozB (DUF420 family)